MVSLFTGAKEDVRTESTGDEIDAVSDALDEYAGYLSLC